MTVRTLVQPDRSVQSGSTYRDNIDNSIAVLAELGQAFAPHAKAVPDLTVLVDAGRMFSNTLVSQAQQTVSGFVATGANQRIDRIVLDPLTGSVTRVAGTQAASPVAPDIPPGKLPVAQVGPFTTSTTAINNGMITDERTADLVSGPRVTTKSVAGNGTVILTSSEQRCDVLILTGVLTGAKVVEVAAAIPWEWTIINQTTGNFTLTVRATGQTGVEIFQGRATPTVHNGTDVMKVGDDPPPGTLEDFAGGTVQAGRLACDGSNVSRTTFAALFNKIGTTHGSGDGSTTFTLPDRRRRVAVGSGGTGTSQLGNAVGNTGGAESRTIGTTNLPASGLSVPSLSVSASGSGSINIYDNAVETTVRVAAARKDADSPSGSQSVSVSVSGSTGTGTTGNMGSGTAFDEMQPSLVVLATIRT